MSLPVTVTRHPANAIRAIAEHGYTLAQIQTLPRVYGESLKEARVRLLKACAETAAPAIVQITIYQAYRTLSWISKVLLALRIDVRSSEEYSAWVVP